MSIDLLLLSLRFISAVILLSFMIALFVVMWRDFRSATTQVQASRRTYGRLVILAETADGYLQTNKTYPLLPLTSIGRAPTNTIMIEEQFASSEHAIIALRNGQWWLEDRNSRNGTLVNGEAATSLIITDGDIISVGSTSLRLELE